MQNGKVVEYHVLTMLGPGMLVIRKTPTGHSALYNGLPITNLDPEKIAEDPNILLQKEIFYGLCPRFKTYPVTLVKRKSGITSGI